MKRILLTCYLLASIISGYCQTEAELKAQLKKDPVFINYNAARLAFVTGIVENKWGFRTANNEMLRNIGKNKSSSELKELYRKAGVDSGYLIAYNILFMSKIVLANKYKAVIKSNPDIFKKVTKELTSAVPKPGPLNLRSPH